MFSILPKDTGFQILLDRSSQTMVSGVRAYSNLIKSLASPTAALEQVRRIEHEGDDNLRQILDKLDRTFLTPFDREDIYRLSRRMDDVIDAVDAASKRFIFYKMTTSTSWLDQLGQVLQRAGEAAGRAVPRLRNLKQTAELRSELDVIHLAEREADDLHHQAVAELYDREAHVGTLMKWKEVYDLTEKAIDRCEDIADVIRGIMVKGT